jgi:hypothetical protein
MIYWVLINIMDFTMTNSEITTKKNEIKERIIVLTDLKSIYESEIQTAETIRQISAIDSNIKELNQRLTNFRRIELERYNKARRDQNVESDQARRDLERRDQERRDLERRDQERRDKERRDLERREREYQDRERERRYQERRDQEQRENARRELERREQEARRELERREQEARRNRTPIGIMLPMRGNFMAPVGVGFAPMVGGFGQMVGGFAHPVGFARSSSVGHHNSHLMEAMRPHTSTTFGLQRLIGPPINFRNH